MKRIFSLALLLTIFANIVGCADISSRSSNEHSSLSSQIQATAESNEAVYIGFTFGGQDCHSHSCPTHTHNCHVGHCAFIAFGESLHLLFPDVATKKYFSANQFKLDSHISNLFRPPIA